MAIITRRSFLATTAAGAAAATFMPRALLAQEAGVVFGAVLPLTGASASIGEDQRRGVELAVEKVNADGGVLGKPLKVVIEDSASNAQTALNAAKKLVSVDGAKVVMGEYSSGVTVPLRRRWRARASFMSMSARRRSRCARKAAARRSPSSASTT